MTWANKSYLGVFLGMLGLATTADAEILPSFSLDYASWQATEIISYRRKCPNARICDRYWLLSQHRRPAADPTLVYEYTT